MLTSAPGSLEGLTTLSSPTTSPSLSSDELEDILESKIENFQKTVEVHLRGWQNCPFISPNEVPKFQRFLEGLHYLLYDRKISLETLFKFQIGFGEEIFRDQDSKLKRISSIYYPMYAVEQTRGKLPRKIKLAKIKSRGLLPEDKRFQRIMPAGAGFGVFGLNTLLDQVQILEGRLLCI